MSENVIDRDSLQEAYINMIVDGMDWKTMEQFVFDTIDANLDNYTVDELITEVKDYYPELLENDEQSVTYGDTLKPASWEAIERGSAANFSHQTIMISNKATMIQVMKQCEGADTLTREQKFEVFCRVCDNMLAEGRITQNNHKKWTQIW